MQLTQLSDEVLLQNTKALVAKERDLLIQVLQHLREVERRRLFAKLGYSSLFEYAVRELRYSEGSAQRRISAMRLMRELPSLEQKIEEGSLSLSVLAQAQTFFRQEGVRQSERKQALLEVLEGKSSREAEKELVARSSCPERRRPEILRPVSETQSLLSIVIDEVFLDQIRQLQGFLAHAHPGLSIQDTLRLAVERELGRKKPKAPRSTAQNSAPSPAPGAPSPPLQPSPPTPAVAVAVEVSPQGQAAPTRCRYIPAAVKRAVWHRDGGRCTFKSADGRACDTRYRLECDHIIAFAQGGPSTVENLRLRCKPHNQAHAIQVFGQARMAAFLPGLKIG